MGTQLTVRLTPQVLLYENYRSTSGAIITTALAWAVAHPLLPEGWGYWVAVVVTVLAVVGMLTDLVMNRVQQRTFALRVGDHGLEMDRGRYITTTMLVVPGAVLSVDVHVGPVLRHLGLARLRLNGTGRLPEVPPLPAEDARAVQRLVVEQLTLTSPSAEDLAACLP